MKTKIFFLVAALASICIIATLGSETFNRIWLGGIAGSSPRSTGTSTPRSFRFRQTGWLGDLRTTVAQIRYLLEAEPKPYEPMVTLIASNGPAKEIIAPGSGTTLSLVPSHFPLSLEFDGAGLLARPQSFNFTATNRQRSANSEGKEFKQG